MKSQLNFPTMKYRRLSDRSEMSLLDLSAPLLLSKSCQERGEEEASVVVRFWYLPGSRHLFHLINSIPHKQQTQCTSRPIAGLRRKSEHFPETSPPAEDLRCPWGRSSFRGHSVVLEAAHPSRDNFSRRLSLRVKQLLQSPSLIFTYR